MNLSDLPFSLHPLCSAPAFVLAGRTYCWSEVLLSAHLRGEWLPLVERTRRGLALVRRLEARGAPMPEAAVPRAATTFRQQRALLTAEEMERWLERWDLSAGAWMDAMRRQVLREAAGEEPGDLLQRHPVPDEEVSAALWAEERLLLQRVDRLVNARLEHAPGDEP